MGLMGMSEGGEEQSSRSSRGEGWGEGVRGEEERRSSRGEGEEERAAMATDCVTPLGMYSIGWCDYHDFSSNSTFSISSSCIVLW